mmetsp:Transcript_17941/g.58687  ORF Transcript_17941/g.58687 Transcript_17941/m.58687 type:complete len:208 (+) Transcript_17941:365-988(+)|eukprot:scaffold12829_cov116-Isochrysis_galbana.AAC.15
MRSTSTCAPGRGWRPDRLRLLACRMRIRLISAVEVEWRAPHREACAPSAHRGDRTGLRLLPSEPREPPGGRQHRQPGQNHPPTRRVAGDARLLRGDIEAHPVHTEDAALHVQRHGPEGCRVRGVDCQMGPAVLEKKVTGTANVLGIAQQVRRRASDIRRASASINPHVVRCDPREPDASVAEVGVDRDTEEGAPHILAGDDDWDGDV